MDHFETMAKLNHQFFYLRDEFKTSEKNKKFAMFYNLN